MHLLRLGRRDPRFEAPRAFRLAVDVDRAGLFGPGRLGPGRDRQPLAVDRDRPAERRACDGRIGQQRRGPPPLAVDLLVDVGRPGVDHQVAALNRSEVLVGRADDQPPVVERQPAAEPAQRLAEGRQQFGRLDPLVAAPLEDEHRARVFRHRVVVGRAHGENVAVKRGGPAVLVALARGAGQQRKTAAERVAWGHIDGLRRLIVVVALLALRLLLI